MDTVPELTPDERRAADARVAAALAQISAEDMAALTQAIARLTISATKNRAARTTGHPTPAAAEPVAKPRTRRPKPSRLAKWEAQWQAEQRDEAKR